MKLSLGITRLVQRTQGSRVYIRYKQIELVFMYVIVQMSSIYLSQSRINNNRVYSSFSICLSSLVEVAHIFFPNHGAAALLLLLGKSHVPLSKPGTPMEYPTSIRRVMIRGLFLTVMEKNRRTFVR